ncbi:MULTISPECIES: ESX secretion-associated protein EspG [Prauserella salsuginis group]|uniref:ESX secretion-associated protein EspG n=1 Tax=Prauserella salsuginis TaxID=387889 RepID=A0ABW6FZ58_9PSEU|nr:MULTISPECIES: ESX secretion-associated protein EspG [Prauserella salsuginis group]MCR3720472.1 EspG family protein [Prauserella flava]MCR3733817.1 EspG family protein [Prauserella salsuginis]
MLEHQEILRTRTLVRLLQRTGTEPHATLEKGATWYSREALQQIDAEIHAELARVGLANENGVHPDLLATVEAIGHPELEYYGWISGLHDGAPVDLSVLAGSGRGEAFTLVNNEAAGVVVLASVPARELVDAFLLQLPQQSPANAHALSVPKAKVEGRKGESLSEDSLMRSEVPDAAQRELNEFKRIMGLERTGGGQLYVAARNRSGQRQRAEKPITYLDTAEGRWLIEETPGTGEPMLAAAPATPELLRSRLREAQRTLAD